MPKSPHRPIVRCGQRLPFARWDPVTAKAEEYFVLCRLERGHAGDHMALLEDNAGVLRPQVFPRDGQQ
jgi:hypothetical protein